jgi:hypothetical protein
MIRSNSIDMGTSVRERPLCRSEAAVVRFLRLAQRARKPCQPTTHEQGLESVPATGSLDCIPPGDLSAAPTIMVSLGPDLLPANPGVPGLEVPPVPGESQGDIVASFH